MTGTIDTIEGDAGGAIRLIAGIVLSVGVHVAGGLVLLPAKPPIPALDAPEAAVLIDLPPELALPPAESVENIAALSVSDLAPAQAEPVQSEEVERVQQSNAVGPIAMAVDPTESTSHLSPNVAEAAPVDAADVVPTEAASAESSSVTEAVPQQAAPLTAATEVAQLAALEEVVAEEAVAPVAPDVKPRTKPRAPAPRRAKERPPEEKATADRAERVREPAARAPSREAVAGTRASGAGRPDPNVLADYSAKVRARIMRQRRSVKLDSSTGTVTVSFTVTTDGGIMGVSIAHSSGNRMLDDAAIRMVQRADPVPPIPSELKRSSISMALPVQFER